MNVCRQIQDRKLNSKKIRLPVKFFFLKLSLKDICTYYVSHSHRSVASLDTLDTLTNNDSPGNTF